MSRFAEYAAVPGLMLAGCRGAGLLFVASVSSPLVPVWCGRCLSDVGVVALGRWRRRGRVQVRCWSLGRLGFELVGRGLGLLALILITALQGGFGVWSADCSLAVVRPNVGEEVDTTAGSCPLALGLFVVLGVPEALFLAVREGMTLPGVMLDVGLMAEAIQPCLAAAFEMLLRCSLPVLTIVLAQTILMGFWVARFPKSTF